MRRLANGTQISAQPAIPAAIGAPGFGTNGDPAGGLQASIFDADAYNALQEELIHVIEAGGLTPDGNSLSQLLAAIRALTPTAVSVVSYTASGTYVPHPKLLYAVIEAVGGGGGGGSPVGGANGGAGGGGGSGAYVRYTLTKATIGASRAITIGAGGVGALTAGATGGIGGGTTVSGLISANGGGGGSGAADGAVGGGGVGGAAGGGDLIVLGQGGGYGTLISNSGVGGAGGSTPFGFGGPATGNLAGAGAIGGGYGAGGAGGGASTSYRAGGDGAQGIVLITEFRGS
jgi:hypothetical protein